MANSIVPKKVLCYNRKTKDVLKEILELIPELKKMIVQENKTDMSQPDN